MANLAAIVTSTNSGSHIYMKPQANLVHGNGSVGAFHDMIHQGINQDTRSVFIDISDITVDAAGLGALIDAYVAARLVRAEIALTGIDQGVRELMLVVKLVTVFQGREVRRAA